MRRIRVTSRRVAFSEGEEKILCSKRKKAWDDEGVASTIGTIMALLVFLTFLGMFSNQYVPVWMKENEYNHMNDVVRQFSLLKMGITTLIENSEEGETASGPMYTPIQLHAEGIPIFATSTAGRLSLTGESSGYPWYYVTFPYGSGDEFNDTNGAKVGGSLEFYGPNRYFVQQTLAFENGAIILNQTDGETVLQGAGMTFKVEEFGGELRVKMTQISMKSMNKTVGGFGTKGISITLDYASYAKFTNTTGGDLTISIGSKYGSAWSSYFTTLLSSYSFLTTSDWSVSSSPTVIGSETFYDVTVTIEDVNLLEHTRALVSVSIADISI